MPSKEGDRVGGVKNQSPKGIMRSAVPLPCFFHVVKSQKVAGQRPRQGTKSCRMGRNSRRPYVRPSVCPSVCPLGIEGLPGGQGGTYVQTYVRTYVRTEFLPILQDFVPCRGRCPKRGFLKICPSHDFVDSFLVFGSHEYITFFVIVANGCRLKS